MKKDTDAKAAAVYSDMFIAIDDTDSRKGMCTTFLAMEVIKEFEDYDLIDYPRLVRLNPNIPWKTRGNGAVVISLGEGKKRKEIVGKTDQRIYLHQGIHSNIKSAFDRVKKVVEEWSESERDHTNPGFVIAEKRPPKRFYEDAVKDVVELDDILKFLDSDDYLYKGYGKKRGLIGATSALAWRPNDFTFELITYRKKKRWGTKRNISDRDVKEFDRICKKTFDNYDYEENRQMIAPTSPCPVLYGVRGDDPEELKKSLEIIQKEEAERWITFLTNQATDDHIQDTHISEVKPWISVKTKCEISSKPHYIQGGHLLFEVTAERENKKYKMTAAAYEPTKGFRKIVEKLIKGDKVELWGGIRKDPLTLNIEKVKILKLEDRVVKVGNPLCPECGTSMSSIGKNAGYRCKKCSTKADESEVREKKVERELTKGWYETPVSARRHLSKPLSRDNTSRSISRRSA